MAECKRVIAGIGELLWDMLPGGRQLGGAPANFAYMCHLLGDEGIVASRLGQDTLGEEAQRNLGASGLCTDYIQRDPAHVTSTVNVEVGPDGQPEFEITECVAWDFLEWTEQWRILAQRADAVCFGSLAQRNAISRETIRKFIAATRSEAVRLLDVNLRQSFYSEDVLAESLKLAHIVKLNHEELPTVARLLKIPQEREALCAERLRQEYELKLVCITRGAHGSLLVNGEGVHEHSGFPVEVVDTVGAGDAFTAALVHCYLRGASLSAMNEAANRLGSLVAAHAGGMPKLPKDELQTLRQIGEQTL